MRVAPQLQPSIEKFLWRAFYEIASARGRDTGAALMNYGYAAPEELEAGDGEDRFGLALYAAVAGAGELSGKQVLEVGCGRGGGAAFVFERFGPSSMTGVDLARTAIERCRRRYGRPGLTFQTGDAQNLPFPPDTFDAVINVESSHCYPDMAAFLGEVRRVLRPGGQLLLADFRVSDSSGDAGDHDDVQALRRQLAEAGLRTLDEQDITAEVLRALSLATPVVRARIERRVPKLFRGRALEFSAVEGSSIFRSFTGGELTYLRFVLEKS
jgi:ubiquinone/menaquinone biosynthesis C-methylase UbiE